MLSYGYYLIVIWSDVRPGCTRLGFDRVWAHHLIILVVHDVAVPDTTLLMETAAKDARYTMRIISRQSTCCNYIVSLWLSRLLRSDAVGTHHLVVLMFDDVAVPHELAGCVELCLYAGDLTRVGGNCIL